MEVNLNNYCNLTSINKWQVLIHINVTVFFKTQNRLSNSDWWFYMIQKIKCRKKLGKFKT